MFHLVSELAPCGDQPKAIDALVAELREGRKDTVLLGITGSGKTFTMANVIATLDRPTLVIVHNKTLAAQLYGEFRDLFPDNAVHYFVSYYDYYQPEAYVPASDTYIAKDSSINEEIDRMRHAATDALLSRRDVIIVASVSCIFGIGSQDLYESMTVRLHRGQSVDRDDVLRRLVDIQYRRSDMDFSRGTFRVRGDVVEVFPVQQEERALRIEWWGDEIEQIAVVESFRGKVLETLDFAVIRPASHYVTEPNSLSRALETIKGELKVQLASLRSDAKLVEAQRLEERTLLDLEMLAETGRCVGIENYSRHLTGRAAGEPAPTLLDYFPDDYLMFIDESHQTLPQLMAMYRGDQSRKKTLVTYGFRLPSALDNRPLQYEEFRQRVNQVVYVSATPGDHELGLTEGEVVEQIVRPTGLLDPDIEVRSTKDQVANLYGEIRKRVAKNQRILVTTLTKRMAEELSEYYQEMGVKVRYLHSDVETLDRIEIIRDLRRGRFDVLVGINLLREGLDLPEVALVAILDADKEGFLRNHRSLMQICGRAARNVDGHVVMYADRITAGMEETIAETNRRRAIQEAYNNEHAITPRTIKKAILDLSVTPVDADYSTVSAFSDRDGLPDNLRALRQEMKLVREKMKAAAKNLDFEEAARLRDRLIALQEHEVGLLGASG
ncbi:MAG: excinuclease ABC subunit UvrB [Deltaproteobacteria bacterium]|nr:excinuclease ABC subunit UvrB [Deltaproteobacteria bacterium]